MKKKLVDTAFGRTLVGENHTGKIIHAVLDILPVPNVHEVAKAVLKKDNPADYLTFAQQFWARLDISRTVKSILFVGLLAYFVKIEVVTPEQAKEIVQLIIQFLFGA